MQLVFLAISSLVLSKLNINLGVNTYTQFIFAYFILFITDVLLLFFRDYISKLIKKRRLKSLISFFYEYFVDLPYIFIMAELVIKCLKKANIAGISIFLISAIILLILVVFKKRFLKNFIFFSHYTKNKKTEDLKQSNTGLNKAFPFLIILIFLIFLCVLAPSLMLISGKVTRLSISDYSQNTIIYSVLGDKTNTKQIYGNVVAQSGDTYYISEYPDRKLVTIKSLYIITEP